MEPEPEPARMAYLSEALERRVYFGPFPTAAEEVDHLLRDLAITHIINLRPTTNETTAKGLPRDSWYTCFWKPDRRGKIRYPYEPELVRLPLPKRDTKRRDLVAWYVKAVSSLAAPPPAGEALSHSPVFYIHNETGLDEEAVLAFTLAQLLSAPGTPALNIDDWIRARPNAQGVLLGEEARTLARECVEAAAATQKGGGGVTKSLLGWVIVRKRDKPGTQ